MLICQTAVDKFVSSEALYLQVVSPVHTVPLVHGHNKDNLKALVYYASPSLSGAKTKSYLRSLGYIVENIDENRSINAYGNAGTDTVIMYRHSSIENCIIRLVIVDGVVMNLTTTHTLPNARVSISSDALHAVFLLDWIEKVN